LGGGNRKTYSPNALDSLSGPADDVRHPRLWGAPMDIVVWLRSLGLGKYEATFRENEIDETVLPNLTAEDLKELASLHWDIAASSSMPSLLCAPMRASPAARSKRPVLTHFISARLPPSR